MAQRAAKLHVLLIIYLTAMVESRFDSFDSIRFEAEGRTGDGKTKRCTYVSYVLTIR